MPWWVAILALAETWHMPPWEIMKTRGAERAWIHRQIAWVDAQNKRAQALQRRLECQQGRLSS